MACLRSKQGSYVWVATCVWHRRVRHVCSRAAAVKSSEALRHFLALPHGTTCVCTLCVCICHVMCIFVSRHVYAQHSTCSHINACNVEAACRCPLELSSFCVFAQQGESERVRARGCVWVGCVYACLRVCARMRVCERERKRARAREKKRETETERENLTLLTSFHVVLGDLALC